MAFQPLVRPGPVSKRWIAFAVLAGVLLLAIPAAYVYADHLAEEAVRRHGRNIDSGATLRDLAPWILAPASLCALAAFWLRLRLTGGGVISAITFGIVVVPMTIFAGLSLLSLFV
jgi:hypothetical protein